MGIFHLYHMENTAVLCNGPVKSPNPLPRSSGKNGRRGGYAKKAETNPAVERSAWSHDKRRYGVHERRRHGRSRRLHRRRGRKPCHAWEKKPEEKCGQGPAERRRARRPMSPACSEPPLSRFAGQHELVGKAGKRWDRDAGSRRPQYHPALDKGRKHGVFPPLSLIRGVFEAHVLENPGFLNSPRPFGPSTSLFRPSERLHNPPLYSRVDIGYTMVIKIGTESGRR